MVLIPLPQEPVRGSGGGARFSAPAVGAAGNAAPQQIQQLGETMLRTGTGLADRMADLDERRHVANVKRGQAKAENEIADFSIDFFNRVGETATGDHRELAWKQLQQKLKAVETGLTDAGERTLFRQIIDRRLTSLRVDVGNYEAKQVRVLEIGAGEAVATAKVNAARMAGPVVKGAPHPSGQDTSSPAFLQRTAREELRSLAQKMGKSPEEVDLYVRQRMSGLHKGIVEDLVDNGRSREAAEYIDLVKGETVPGDLNRMRDLTRTGGVKERGARIANEVIEGIDAPPAGFTGPVPPGGVDSETLLFEAERQLKARWEVEDITIEEYEQARSFLHSQAKLREGEEIRARRELREDAERLLIDNPTWGIDQLPESMVHRLKDEGLFDEVNGFAQNDRRRPVDPAVMSQVYMRDPALLSLSREKFVSKLEGVTSESGLRHALAIWDQWNKVKDPARANVDTQLFEAGVYHAGLVNRNAAPSVRAQQWNSPRIEAFRFHVEQQILEVQERLGRKLSQAEERDLVFRAADNRTNTSVPWGSDERRVVGSFTREEIRAADLRMLENPDDQFMYQTRDQLIAAWRRRNPVEEVPEELLEADPLTYFGQMPKAVGDYIRIWFREKVGQLTVNQDAQLAMWVLADRPRTVGEMVAKAEEMEAEEADEQNPFINPKLTPEMAVRRWQGGVR